MRGADPLLLDYLALEQAVGFIQIVAIDPIGKLQFLKLVIDLLLLPDAVITVPAIGCLAIGVDLQHDKHSLKKLLGLSCLEDNTILGIFLCMKKGTHLVWGAFLKNTADYFRSMSP